MTQTYSIHVNGIFQGYVQAISRNDASNFAKDHYGANAMVMWERK